MKNTIEQKINTNMGEFYLNFYLAIKNKNNLYRLGNYLTSLSVRGNNKSRADYIIFEISELFLFGKFTGKVNNLPDVYLKELWRGQRLINAIIFKRIRTKRRLENEIAYWAQIDMGLITNEDKN